MFEEKQQTTLMKRLAKFPRNSKERDLELANEMGLCRAKLMKKLCASPDAIAATVVYAKECIANNINKADFIVNLNNTKEVLGEFGEDPVKSIEIMASLVSILEAATEENYEQTLQAISVHRFSVRAYQFISDSIRLVDIQTSKALKDLVKDYLKSRDELCLPHMRLVHKLAQGFLSKPSSHDLEDLTTQGWEGLVIAADRFDPSIWQHFGTYASNWIKQVLQRYTINYGTTIRVPVHLSENISEITKKSIEIESLTGVKPTAQELAIATNLTLERVQRAQSAIYQPMSLDFSLKGNQVDATSSQHSLLSEVIEDTNAVSPDQETFDNELRELVSSILKDTLDARSIMVMSLRYGLISGEESAMKEVGSALNISRERARQITDKSLDLIRARTKTKVLKDFLT